MKKYLIPFTMIVLFIAIPFATIYGAEESESLNLAPDAISAILIERDTGQVLYNKNEHEKLPPASMTKINNLYIIMEALDYVTQTLDVYIRLSTGDTLYH